MKLEYAVLYSSDLDRAIRFYEGLGLKLEDRQGDKFVSIRLDNSLIGIKKAESEREVPGYQTIILAVKDAQRFYDDCKGRGLKFYKEISKESWGTNFAILDPDGNKVEIMGRIEAEFIN